ncbi:alpha-hydroxy-acid oxidizing protein [Desulfovibrio inopinatus]|uniref:alpha-hydroxy-acid oxidizing protein n=1 Tax=Desulfovibrio inopinatus TaxID=102109 RepID=UPI0004270B8F|nr:alpha-hydroxy-acid oxidizing protein [Desulfovibrio inopinatus]
MDLIEIKKRARQRLKGFCRVCPVCNGTVCAGEVPGMGGLGTSSSFTANVEALKALRFHMRTLHGVTSPDTSIELFGRSFTTPVQAAPMTGVVYNMGGDMSEAEFIGHVVAGATKAGSAGWIGDGADPAMFESGLEAIKASGGGIAIIKPRSQDEIKARIAKAEEAGCIAVGVDVDGAGLVTMAKFGQPVSPKTPNEIAELVQSTSLPFILKGIMTKEEGKIAAEAGCAAIVVSNHGGRVLDHTPGAAEVLPYIAKKVGDKLTILADGGVRTGSDVLKLLALGAQAVLTGRPLVWGAFGKETEGVTTILDTMKAQLIGAMLLTGTADVKNVDKHILV